MSLTIAELKVRISGDLADLRRDMSEATTLARQSATDAASAAQQGQAAQRAAHQEAVAQARERAAAQKQLADEMGRGMTIAGTAIVAGMGVAVKVAADYEQSLNVLRVAAHANNEQMAQMSALASKLGADTKLPATSAKDAAAAMVELSRAGLSVKDTMGAARSVLQLSAAAQMSNAEAAKITGTALNAFKLPGTEAGKVANLLAGAANSAQGSVSDMGQALTQSAAVFSMAKMPIEENVTAISMMAKAGVMGSDAGTSLKTMMLSLMAPTDQAAALMQKLGIHTRDSNGQMLPLRDLVGEFTAKLGGLGNAQRDAAMKTIFGTDAIRSGNIVLTAGVDAYDKMFQSVGRLGQVEESAEARTKGFSGQVEALKSQLETIAIKLGTALLPTLTRLTDGLSATLKWFDSLSPSTQAWVAQLTAAAGVFLLLAPRIMEMVRLYGLLKTAMGGVGAAGAAAGTGGATAATAAGGGLLSRLLGPLAAGFAGQQAGGFVMDRALEANADTAQGRLRRAAGEHVRDQLMDITKGGMWGGIASLFKEMTGGIGSSLTPAQRAAALAGNRNAASLADPLGDPADALVKKAAGGSAKESAFEMPSSAAAKQQEALLAAITKARNELNQAEKTGLGIASQVAAAFPQATAAKRAELVVLLQRREAIKDQQAEDARFRDTLAQAQGKTRDLTAALSGQKTGLEQLRAEHPKWSESMLRAVNNQNQWNASLKAAADQRAKAAADRQREVERFNQALENQKAQERDAVAALRGEGDSIERLRVAYPGVTDAKLRDLQASKAHTDAVIAQKKAAEDLAEAQKRAAEQAVEAKKKEQEAVASWFAEQKAAIADTEAGSGFGRAIARFGGAMSPAQQGEARALYQQREEAEQLKKVREESEKLRGTVAASASPFSLASVAASTLGQSYESLGDKAKAALAPLARLMREAAESDLLRKAALATNQAQAQLQSTVTGNPLFALRAQNPGISDAALRQLAGQQAAQNSANWQNQMIQGRTQNLRSQWDQLAQSQMGGMTEAERRRLEYAQSRLSGLPEPTTDAARQRRLQFTQSLMGSDAQKFGLAAGDLGGGGAEGQLAEFEKAKKTLFGSGEGQDAFFPAASKGMEFVSTAASSLTDNLKAGEGGLGGALTVINQKIPETVGFLSMLAEAIAMIGTAAASAANQAAAGAPGASPAQAAQDAGRRQALAAARGG